MYYMLFTLGIKGKKDIGMVDSNFQLSYAYHSEHEKHGSYNT